MNLLSFCPLEVYIPSCTLKPKLMAEAVNSMPSQLPLARRSTAFRVISSTENTDQECTSSSSESQKRVPENEFSFWDSLWRDFAWKLHSFSLKSGLGWRSHVTCSQGCTHGDIYSRPFKSCAASNLFLPWPVTFKLRSDHNSELARMASKQMSSIYDCSWARVWMSMKEIVRFWKLSAHRSNCQSRFSPTWCLVVF